MLNRFTKESSVFLSAGFFLIVACASSLDIVIPWPSGILINKALDMNGVAYRVGRLQHSVVNLRPQWSTIHLIKKVFSKSECSKIIAKAENLTKSGQNVFTCI